jgi:glycosyltransferase involved in cell wall biosynthesis
MKLSRPIRLVRLPGSQAIFSILRNIRGIIRTTRRRLAVALTGNTDLETCVDLIYRHYCGRAVDPEALKSCIEVLRAGTALSELVQGVAASVEAQERRKGLSGEFDEISDGEFILNIGELLFEGGGATPAQIVYFTKFLGENRARRIELVRRLINAHIERQREEVAATWDLHPAWIMGTKHHLTLAVWEEKSAKLVVAERTDRLQRSTRERRAFKHSGDYVVSAIASLYKGRRFIEKFLENITTQTIFDRCELIIIDADSPEGEEEIIAEYQKVYPNIVYRRINYRIGVYDAWNLAVQLARGRYLTNTNIDDLRRSDSFELQAGTLDANPAVDVVYQDFFYTLDPSLSFDEVASLGFRTELPIITACNLLTFNSLHNAPMWRKAVHKEVGLFDTSYKSAGDWEFWLRSLWKGKKFFKVNIPHAAYYHNPEGLSTRADTSGLDESKQILRRYSRRLISSQLLLSRQAFADLLGVPADWDEDVSYYEVVQRELRRLGEDDRLAPTGHSGAA